MRRTGPFLIVFGTSISLLLAVLLWYLVAYNGNNASMSGIMGQMMGNQYASGMTASMPFYVWATVVGLFVLAAIGIAGAVYYLAYPEIRTETKPSHSSELAESAAVSHQDWSVLLRTSKPEEKKVLDALASHDGKYLQKFIVKETGLSKLKTHRIIARLAERGIIRVSKSGNTNEVTLADWLTDFRTTSDKNA